MLCTNLANYSNAMRTANLVSIRVIRGVFFNTNLSNLSNAMRLANLDSIREIRVKKTLRAASLHSINS